MKNKQSSQKRINNQGVVLNGPSPNSSEEEKSVNQAQTYPLLDNVNGHVVFKKDEQLVFVDTGANVSFGRQAKWEFMGETYDLPPGFPIINPDYLTRQIGVPIDFLVGMNILKDYSLKINFRGRQITFSKDPLPVPDSCKRMEIKLVHGCLPYASIKMNGTFRKVHIDTGAKINFLRMEALADLEPYDKEMDFSPYEEEEFETEIYNVPVEIVDEILEMRTGILPPNLEVLIDKTNGLEGALGTGLYEKYIATFDFQNRVLSLEESKEDIIETQKLYVTDAGFDDIGAILSALGEGYEIINIPLGSSSMLDELGDGDVIFINCSDGCRSVARDWSSHLQKFVSKGGSIYVSDWAGSLLETAFPEYVRFNRSGNPGMVHAVVTDDGLAETLGGEISLNFDMGSWWRIRQVSEDVMVHIRANDMPLLVSFKVGNGHVIYTSFHNRAQVSEVEAKLLQYLVFKPILSREAEFALDQIREREFVPTKELYSSMPIKDMSPERQFSIDIDNPRTILCIISWKGNAHLTAKLQNPDGEIVLELTSESSPLNLEYFADKPGKWIVHVNAPYTPYDNFPYVVHFATGDKKSE